MNAIEHLDFINELFSEEEGFMTFTDAPVKDEEEVEMRKTQPITYKIHEDKVVKEDKVVTPVQKEVIAPVRDFINSKEDAVRTNAILLRFLEVAKGRSMQGLGTIVKRYLSVRYLPALKTKNYTIHVFQVNAYHQQQKICFAVIERDGVLLSSRLMSREEFNAASKYSALAKKKAFYKKNMFHAYTGK